MFAAAADIFSPPFPNSARHLVAIFSLCILEAVFLIALFIQWRKRVVIESVLRENEKRMSLAMKAGRAALWVWDIRADDIWITKEGRALFGWRSNERINFKRFRKTLNPTDRRQVDRTIETALGAGGHFEAEYHLPVRNGEPRWVRTVGELELEKGKAVRMRGVLIDITPQREAQIEAEQRQQELVHLSRAEIFGQISGSLAHEINQPLSAMLTNTQVALKILDRTPQDTKELSAILADIVSDNRRANEIVVRLRNLLRKEKQVFERYELNTIIKEIVHLIRGELVFHRVACSFDFHPSDPVVYCDRVQIQQVLVNLIKNAWEGLQTKMTEDRNVMIRTMPHENNHWVVTINNNGDPIPDEVFKTMFRPFVSTKETGLGMGLSICRTIIENHNGRIWAENNQEGGATFSFTLPVGKGDSL